MRNYFDETFEWDENGNKKRKRVARPGDTIRFPMTAMDAARGAFSPTFSDGSIDHTSPHRKGFRFSDTDSPAKLAAERAYRERSARMQNKWRDGKDIPAPLPPPLSVDEANDRAIAAYEANKKRLNNLWKDRLR